MESNPASPMVGATVLIDSEAVAGGYRLTYRLVDNEGATLAVVSPDKVVGPGEFLTVDFPFPWRIEGTVRAGPMTVAVAAGGEVAPITGPTPAQRIERQIAVVHDMARDVRMSARIAEGRLHLHQVENLREQADALEGAEATLSLHDALVDALKDLLSGWRYIRDVHGDLYGVGWDRAQDKATAVLSRLGHTEPTRTDQ